jgi:hypothetical protein
MVSDSNSQPIKVFIAYSRNPKDEPLKTELKQHLATLCEEEKITIWDDQSIPPGSEWERVINDNLHTANVILLLYSSDFTASAYCTTERERALQRHKTGEAIVIAVILRPVDLPSSLKDLQALPNEGKAITTWKNEDSAFKNVATGIRRIVEPLYQDRQAQSRQNALRQFREEFRQLLRTSEGNSEGERQRLRYQIQVTFTNEEKKLIKLIEQIEQEEIEQRRTEIQNEIGRLKQRKQRIRNQAVTVQHNIKLNQKELNELDFYTSNVEQEQRNLEEQISNRQNRLQEIQVQISEVEQRISQIKQLIPKHSRLKQFRLPSARRIAHFIRWMLSGVLTVLVLNLYSNPIRVVNSREAP